MGSRWTLTKRLYKTRPLNPAGTKHVLQYNVCPGVSKSSHEWVLNSYALFISRHAHTLSYTNTRRNSFAVVDIILFMLATSWLVNDLVFNDAFDVANKNSFQKREFFVLCYHKKKLLKIKCLLPLQVSYVFTPPIRLIWWFVSRNSQNLQDGVQRKLVGGWE